MRALGSKMIWCWLGTFLLFGPTTAAVVPSVRTAYLVPSDRLVNPAYEAAIEHALLHLQDWFADQLNGVTFTLHTPIVETFTTPHPASYYASNPRGDFPVWFFNNVVDEGFALTGGTFNDPDFRWVYYIDADNAPAQIGGAALFGVTELPAADLRGLVGQEPAPISRWIGGLGHELGHTFGLPHPPGCDDGTLACPMDALMWLGYTIYPDTFLLPQEKATLLSSPFFTRVTAVPEPVTALLLSVGLLGLVMTISNSRRVPLHRRPAVSWRRTA